MEINEIINDLTERIDNIDAEKASQREEAIKKLVELRNDAIELVNRAKDNLDKAQLELEKSKSSLTRISKGLCQIRGYHKFSNWQKSKPKFVEGDAEFSSYPLPSYYYRTCEICGKTESTYDRPLYYRK